MLFIFAIVIAIVGIGIFRTAKKEGNRQRINIGSGVIGVGIIIGLTQCFTVIPAGNVGVVDFFGNVSDFTLKSGVNFVNPFANVVKFNIKRMEIKENMSVPSKEGLSVQLEISLVYQLNPDRANYIYKTVGVNFADVILIPQFRSVVRGVTSKSEAKALYTSQREGVERDIEDQLRAMVEKDGIMIVSAPMRQISLPEGLTVAIEEKLKAEQESQRMQFILLKEKQEADRKRIEAQGISDFQVIVTKGLSEPLLKWKGIEATEKLANSKNTKVVIIGAGKNGLPVILGNDQEK